MPLISATLHYDSRGFLRLDLNRIRFWQRHELLTQLDAIALSITGLILGEKTIGQVYDLATQQSFPTPWVTITGMWVAAWLFSLLTTILPAWQASRIYPAEALRYE